MVEGTECITPIFNHPSRSEESSSTANPPGSVQDSTTSTITYTLFKFDVNVEREQFNLPLDFAKSLPSRVVEYSCLRPYLMGKVFIDSEKCVAFHCFDDDQEACSSCGRCSNKLMRSMKDRKKSGGYVVLPNNLKLRTAEVFDGGLHYEHTDVQCAEDGEQAYLQVCYHLRLVAFSHSTIRKAKN